MLGENFVFRLTAREMQTIVITMMPTTVNRAAEVAAVMRMSIVLLLVVFSQTGEEVVNIGDGDTDAVTVLIPTGVGCTVALVFNDIPVQQENIQMFVS